MLRRAICLFAFVILAGAATTVEAQSRGLGRVNGTVVDEAGAAVDGVAIKAPFDGGSIDASSDAKGNWSVLGLGRGEWKVTFTKAGYRPVNLKVTIEREIDRLQPVKIVMKKP